jgi:hypothetical protein
MNTSSYRAVDHVMVRLLNIDRLLSLFANVLGIPVSWPKQVSPFATFAWVHVGNTDLELWASTNNSDLPEGSQPPLIHGFALDPADLDASIAELSAMGIRCKPPRPYQTRNESGNLATNFTNSVVLDLSSESCCIFFCAWDPNGTIFPWKERLTSVERSARDRQELVARQGGALGLIGLSEIEMSTPNLTETEEKWRDLTGSQHMPLKLTSEISLKLLSGNRHVIRSLTFEVRSLEAARAVLLSSGLLGAASEIEITLDPAETDGLELKFRESSLEAQRAAASAK